MNICYYSHKYSMSYICKYFDYFKHNTCPDPGVSKHHHHHSSALVPFFWRGIQVPIPASCFFRLQQNQPLWNSQEQLSWFFALKISHFAYKWLDFQRVSVLFFSFLYGVVNKAISKELCGLTLTPNLELCLQNLFQGKSLKAELFQLLWNSCETA